MATTVIRCGALLSAGAFGVHQLRYRIAHGSDAGAALDVSGHGYLTFLEPLIGLALAFAVGQVLVLLAGGRVPRRSFSRRSVALAFAGALLAIYTGQELLEGALASGHASGVDGVFGAGGWVALPLALVIGSLLACTVRVVAAAAERVVLQGIVPRPRGTSASPSGGVTGLVPLLRDRPMARHLAGRAPPRLLFP